jgi:hypothetical protein
MASSRRGFLGMLAGWAGAAAVPTPAKTPAPTPASTPPAAPSALVLAARERYGKFLTEEERGMLDERVAGIERRGARLRAYALENSDEPAAEFSAARR